MEDSHTHPIDPSGDESPTDWVVRTASQAGFLGFLGFLEHLQFLNDLFATAQIFYLFFLLFLVSPVAFVLNSLWDRLVADQHRSSGEETETKSYYDDDDPRYWVKTGYESSPLKTVQALAIIVHPNVFIRGLLQIGGAIVAFVRHGGRLPHPETCGSAVTYSPPFEGEWTVVNGSPDRRYSHSWVPVRQRYAYDFVITDDMGRTNDGSGGVESFYCFDEPILSPAEGTVVRTKDGHRDHHRTSGWIDPLQYRLAGNYVVIKHAETEYSLLAHLRKGSICVSPGEHVERGQQIGRCGHSGNSSEPHLHFHVQDHSFPYIGAGLPIRFEGRTTHPEISDHKGDRIWVHCGQTVISDPE